jgi:hypothetical protein
MSYANLGDVKKKARATSRASPEIIMQIIQFRGQMNIILLTDCGKQHSRTRNSSIKSHRYATGQYTHNMSSYQASKATCSVKG